jgi:hypothetical protein
MITGEVGFLSTVIIYIAVIVGIANVCLLSGLIYFYRESYKEISSKFTIGLLYFTTILLIQNILAIVAMVLFLNLSVEIHELIGLEFYTIMLLINLAQLVALAILFKITWE